MIVEKDATGNIVLDLNTQEAQSLMKPLSRHADKNHAALLDFVCLLNKARPDLRRPAHSLRRDARHPPAS